MLKDPVEKMDSIPKQVESFSKEMETVRKNQMAMVDI